MAYGNTNDFAGLGRQIGQNLGQIGAGQAANAQQQFEFVKDQTKKAYRGEIDKIILDPDIDSRTKQTMVHQIGARYDTSITEMGTSQQFSYLLRDQTRRADPDMAELSKWQTIAEKAGGEMFAFDPANNSPLDKVTYEMASKNVDRLTKKFGGGNSRIEQPVTANASVGFPIGNVNAQVTSVVEPVQSSPTADPIQPIQVTGKRPTPQELQADGSREAYEKGKSLGYWN
jgi:hypothetical protein